MLLLQELQVGHLVAAQVAYNVLVPQEIPQLARLFLELLELGNHLLPGLGKLGGRGIQILNLAVQVGHVVGHVGLLEQLVLGLGDLLRLLLIFAAALLIFQLCRRKLEEGENKVSVEAENQLREEVELGDVQGLGPIRLCRHLGYVFGG